MPTDPTKVALNHTNRGRDLHFGDLRLARRLRLLLGLLNVVLPVAVSVVWGRGGGAVRRSGHPSIARAPTPTYTTTRTPRAYHKTVQCVGLLTAVGPWG